MNIDKTATAPKIKICGLSRLEDADFVNQAHADFAGFVFAPSRRQVFPTQARLLRDKLDAAIKAVGVFVDTPISQIARLTADGIIQLVQLHGNQNDEFISDLKSVCSIPIIKAIRIDSEDDIINAQNCPADYVLFDNGSGGTGNSFYWRWLEKASRAYFLAGGLNIENAIEAAQYRPFAMDVSSGVETNGIKDRYKILEFVRRIRESFEIKN